jgi:hypothetical protein
MFVRCAIVSDGDIRSAISRLGQAWAEDVLRLAENSHDFSHDSTDPSKIGEAGEKG